VHEGAIGAVLERAASGNRPVEAVLEMAALQVEMLSVESLKSAFERVVKSQAREQPQVN